jgi:hypothetical protein
MGTDRCLTETRSRHAAVHLVPKNRVTSQLPARCPGSPTCLPVPHHPTTDHQGRASGYVSSGGNTQVSFAFSNAMWAAHRVSTHIPTSEQRSNCKVKTITPSDCGVSFAHQQADVWDDSWKVEPTVHTVRHTRGQESRTVPLLALDRWSTVFGRPFLVAISHAHVGILAPSGRAGSCDPGGDAQTPAS